MKRFSFKLERVLKLKKLKETLKKRELGVELKNLHDKDELLNESKDIKSKFNEDFNSVNRVGSLNPVTFRRYGSYMRVLSDNIQKTQEAKEEQIIKVDEARQNVKSAVDETKIFNKLRDIGYKKYIMESDKEMEKEMSEMAIARFRRQKSESGTALNVLMAIGASTLAAIILMIGLMFVFKILTPAKVQLMTQILRYNPDTFDKVKVYGVDDPYILDYNRLEELRNTEKKYLNLVADGLDDDNVITKDVQDQRALTLNRIGVALNNTKMDIDKGISKLKSNGTGLDQREKALEKAKKRFQAMTQSTEAKRFSKAQDDILKSMESMDPEAIVKIITAEKKLDDLKEPYKNKAVSYAASYISKLKTRKRAGVMETLTPDWAMAVNNFLEGNNPN